MRRSGTVSGAYSTMAPFARANSRIPLTELWLSTVNSKRPPASKGYDSPTSFNAPEAFRVKTAVYSSVPLKGKHCGTRPFDQLRRVRRTRIRGVRIAEHVLAEQLRVLPDLRVGVEAATCVVEIRLPLRFQAAVPRHAQLIESARGGIGRVAVEKSCERRHRIDSSVVSLPRSRTPFS